VTADIPDEVLENWDDRWRYPQTAVNPEDLVGGVLDGLELALSSREESLEILVGRRCFTAAEALFADDEDLLNRLGRARDEAVGEIDRRRAVLAGRAARAGVHEEPAEEIRRLARSDPSQATEVLDNWESEIAAIERERRAELVARARNLPEGRREAVEQSLERAAYDIAELILRQGPGEPLEGGPGIVPRRLGWPYGGYGLREVLDWYRSEEDPTPGFRARWRPHPSDQPARSLIASYAELVEHGVDEERGRRFISALDRVLEGAENHEIRASDGGIRSAITGLREPKLPVLGLRTPFPVWLAPADRLPPPPGEFPRPCMWVVIGDGWPQPLPGVAVVGAPTVFELAAPVPEDGASAPVARRVALLRTLCPQLPFSEILPEVRTDSDRRWQIAWAMDLAGVSADEAAIDILMRDTSEHPVALRVALWQLLDDAGQVRDLSPVRLDGWRTDTRMLARFRESMLRELGSDPEVSSVVHAVLYARGAYGQEEFRAADIEVVLRDLQPSAVAPDLRVRIFPDLAKTLKDVVATGLLLQDGEVYRLLPGGLPELLTKDPEGLKEEAERALRLVLDQRRRLAEQLMGHATRRAISHLEANHFMSFRELVFLMEQYRPLLPEKLADLLTQVISQFRQFESYRRIELDKLEQEIARPDSVDVGVLLQELAQQFQGERFEFEVREGEKPPYRVIASRLLLRLAIENLLTNARQAITAAEPGRGTIRMSVRAEDEQTLIDIEDSGQGVPQDLHEQIARGKRVSQRPGGGRGLSDARTLLGYWGGSLTLMRERSELGGAHFRVTLPSASADRLLPS